MQDTIDARACQLAVYMIENRGTVRSAAKAFGISKSTVHKDLSVRLPKLDQMLYQQVRSLNGRKQIPAPSSGWSGYQNQIPIEKRVIPGSLGSRGSYRSSASCTGISHGSSGSPV